MKKTSIIELFLEEQDQEFSDAVRAYERQDYPQALTQFESLAQRGDPQAQINLAIMLRKGLGTPVDPVNALMWLELAARNGDEIAIQERDRLGSALTPQQLAQANRQADDRALAA
ncbi:MAG: sel1 repeat family protein [Magnetococcales bacterium]|nr:sel1 repeat family protein [Magnetococcales bacterium]